MLQLRAEIGNVGCTVLGHLGRFCGSDVGADPVVRLAHGRRPMNGTEILGLIVTVGLLAYLTIALLKPEWFS
jgi:K+-transporting ATPase KdpF subunit